MFHVSLNPLFSPPAFNRTKVCRYGTFVYNAHDRYVGQSLERYGEYSEFEVELFRQLVRPGDTVVDAGANFGAHTLVFARLAGPLGAVLAFEPQRVVFQTLCANMALNSITNAHCFQMALGAQAGQVVVPPIDYTRDDNYGGVGLGAYAEGEAVQMMPLDGASLSACRFIKVDVEGMELDVLRGAEQTLRRLQPIVYVENDRADRAADLIAYLSALGYALYWHRPPLYNPANFAGNPDNVFGPVASVNMLCIPRSQNVPVEGLEAVQAQA